MSLRGDVRNYLCGLTLEEMQKEHDLSIERNDQNRARYILEFMDEVRREEEIRYPSVIEVSSMGTVFSVCFRNTAIKENYIWVFADRDTYRKAVAELEESSHIEILAKGNAIVKGK